jgi:hypothetical protein
MKKDTISDFASQIKLVGGDCRRFFSFLRLASSHLVTSTIPKTGNAAMKAYGNTATKIEAPTIYGASTTCHINLAALLKAGRNGCRLILCTVT